MRLAFYAPMKPPDDPVPSGDRTIARAVIAALTHLGASVDLASAFRARDGRGDRSAQLRLIRAAKAEVEKAVAEGRRAGWQAWITYHNYYKAPDLIGPEVAAALGIPYVLIEATRAKKRLTGRWAAYARAAEAATDAADLVFYASERDAFALRRDAPEGQQLRHLPPFLTAPLQPYAPVQHSRMLSAGMMRAGDKLASYKIIADTLRLIADQDWTLDIAGDGPARAEVEAMMAPFADRITYLGQLDDAGMAEAFAQNALFFWPGVNEALGMVYLEAQAAGSPVIAQDRPGLSDLLAPGAYPPVEAGPQGLADMLTGYLQDAAQVRRDGQAAHAHVAENHLLPKAAEVFADGLRDVSVHP